MERTKKIIAFTDSINECDCCGKKGLKGTFCVLIDGNEFYYGSTCAFKKHGFTKEETKKEYKAFEERQFWLKKSNGKFDNKTDYYIDWENTIGKEIEEWANSNH